MVQNMRFIAVKYGCSSQMNGTMIGGEAATTGTDIGNRRLRFKF
jgi:hypothetical protein